MNIIPPLFILFITSATFWMFRHKIFSFKRKRSDKILCRIIKTGQKPIEIRVNRSRKFFVNSNKEDKTQYKINLDEGYITKKLNIVIDYRYGVADPISFKSSSLLMLLSNDIKNALESNIIQDFKASIIDKLFTTMDIKLTLILIGTIINIVGLLIIGLVFYTFKQDVTPVLQYAKEEMAK